MVAERDCREIANASDDARRADWLEYALYFLEEAVFVFVFAFVSMSVVWFIVDFDRLSFDER